MWRAVIPRWWACHRTRDLQTLRLDSPKDKGSPRHLNKLIALGQVALVTKYQNVILQSCESKIYFTLARRNYASFPDKEQYWNFTRKTFSALIRVYEWEFLFIFHLQICLQKTMKLSICVACTHTIMLTPTFTTPMWIQFGWITGVILRFGLVLCTKYEYIFKNKSTALKPAGALFRDGETPKWHVQVNKQVKRGCPGLVMQALVGQLPGCPASCAWLGWEAVEEHSPKGSTDDLFPPLFFLLLSPSSLLSRRIPCKEGVWVMRRKASPSVGGARKLLWAPKMWIERCTPFCCLLLPAPSLGVTAERRLF